MNERNSRQWTTESDEPSMLGQQHIIQLDGHGFGPFNDGPMLKSSRALLNVNPYTNRHSWDRISAETGEHLMVMAQTTDEPDVSRDVSLHSAGEQGGKGTEDPTIDAVVADIMWSMSVRKSRGDIRY